MATGGYDFEVIGKYAPEYNCPICLLLIRNASELPCTHALCRSCLNHYQENNVNMTAEPPCPTCQRPFQRSQVNESRFVDRIITTSLDVKCQQSMSGCNWHGTISDYENHERNCLHLIVSCGFPGCNIRLKRLKIDEHNQQCAYRWDNCKYCAARLQFLHLKKHYEVCLKIPEMCQNGCGQDIPRDQMGEHRQTVCRFQLVQCRYSTIGCETHVLRKDVSIHMSKDQSNHMDLLLEHTIKTSNELQDTKEELKATRDKLVHSREHEGSLIGRIGQLEEKQAEANRQNGVRNKELLESIMLLGCCADSAETKSIGVETLLKYLKEEKYKHYTDKKKKEIIEIQRRLFKNPKKPPADEHSQEQVVNQLRSNVYSLGIPVNYTGRYALAMDRMTPHELYLVDRNFFVKVDMVVGRRLKVSINHNVAPGKEGVEFNSSGQTLVVGINHPQASGFVRMHVMEDEKAIKGTLTPNKSNDPSEGCVVFDQLNEEHIYFGYTLLKIKLSKSNVSCKTQ